MNPWTVTITDLAADLDMDGFAVDLDWDGPEPNPIPDTSSRWFATKAEAERFADDLAALLITSGIKRFPTTDGWRHAPGECWVCDLNPSRSHGV